MERLGLTLQCYHAVDTDAPRGLGNARLLISRFRISRTRELRGLITTTNRAEFSNVVESVLLSACRETESFLSFRNVCLSRFVSKSISPC